MIVDRALAQKLERAEGLANAAFVEAHALLSPESGASWMEVGGVYAMFDGPDSPITQTFGLGLFDPIGNVEMEQIESFFAERGAHVDHEVSPLADKGILTMLVERGYHPLELSTVMYLPLDAPRESAPLNPRIAVGVAGPDRAKEWVQTLVTGWSEVAEFVEMFADLARVVAAKKGSHPFFAELDGRMIAAGSLNIEGKVALLAGASTVPSGRNQGAQRALLDARLRFAAEHGCEIAMMVAEPGSGSQRNAQRQGFHIAYTRTKWRRSR